MGSSPGGFRTPGPRGAHDRAGLCRLVDRVGSRSESQPPSRVSNDNPFSESQFKTLKYQPDLPGRFRGAEHARAW